jgi:hypothetical protein
LKDYFFKKSKEMREHRQAGMKIPPGDSASSIFARKKELLRQVLAVGEMPKDFRHEVSKFKEHMVEFEKHYDLRAEKMNA